MVVETGAYPYQRFPDPAIHLQNVNCNSEIFSTQLHYVSPCQRPEDHR